MTQLDELRHIIVGDNSQQLAELKDRIQDVEQRANDVAEVLSPAIKKEVASDPSTLADSLQHPVSLGLKRAIRSEPEEYAEILYPVMAPSIRRAIAQAISSMMVTINRTIESATTVQGVSLRYESIRTGIPYAELALQRTLLYRVEHLYLIHRETGMAMMSVHAEDTNTLDSDAVSAMFSAIQSFVQDSFSRDETSRLTDLKVGEQNVWVAHGPQAMLACVIRGDAPESFKLELYDTMDLIRTHYANAIFDFNGDQTVFDNADSILSPLLQSELKESDNEAKQDGKKSTPLANILIATAIIAALVYFIVIWALGRSELSTVDHFLDQTPGVSVSRLYFDGDELVVSGMMDPDAVIPFETLESHGIERERLRFDTIPFRSLESSMELQRFESEFELPTGVVFKVADKKIALEGRAPLQWLEDNGHRLLQLYLDGRLVITDLSASEKSVKARLYALFPMADFDSIQLTSGLVGRISDPRIKVEVGGSVAPEVLSELEDLFLSNDWVSIIAKPKS